MSPAGKRMWQLAVGLAISLAVLVWLFSGADLARFRASLAKFSPAWAIVLMLVYAASFPLRGLRWQLMLRPVKPVSWGTSTGVLTVGYMANNLLPARLGEFVRAFALGRRAGVSKITALASIAVERIFDGLIVVALFALTATAGGLSHQANPVLAQAGLGALVLFVSALGGLILARVFPHRLTRLVLMFFGWAPVALRDRIAAACSAAAQAVAFLRLDWTLPVFLCLSLAVWMVEGAMFLLALVAFGLPAEPVFAFFVLAVVNLGVLIPSAPGYVGVFQGCAVLAFAAYGLDKEQALGYAVAVHAIQYLPVTLAGLILLPRMGMSLNTLWAADERRSNSPGDYISLPMNTGTKKQVDN